MRFNYRVLAKALSVSLLAMMSGLAAADYSQHPLADEFVQEMVKSHGFNADEVRLWLSKAEKKQAILDAMAKPAEKSKTWKEYRPIFIQPLRVTRGIEFWEDNRTALAKAEQTYGVPAEIIVAIIGVETNYGKNTGSYMVLDALATLAFDYPARAPFFRSELINYLVLTRDHQVSPLKFKGSYAGAMGYGQFMPSSYRNYAIDFTGDGFADIWENPVDAIGSVANYFKQHGWQTGQAVTYKAHYAPKKLQPNQQQQVPLFNQIQPPQKSLADWQKLGVSPLVKIATPLPAIALEFEGEHGLEYWLGFQNFYVITRYNRSPMYAMAVYQLSQEIKAAHAKVEAKLSAKASGK